MILLSATQISAYAPDVLLIVISSIACLYCWLLSQRLKKLNSLKTGVGASILHLTKAIEDTHKAAQDAQDSTQKAVATLKDLLERSESATPKVEALVMELTRAEDNARLEHTKMEDMLDITLPKAMDEAQNTAASLMQIIAAIQKSQHVLSASVVKTDEDEDQAPRPLRRAAS